MAENQEVKQRYEKIKEMYEKGVPIKEIAYALKIGNGTVYNALSNMALPRRRKAGSMGSDVNELVYADNTVVLKKVVIYGKRYIDVTPIFAPR